MSAVAEPRTAPASAPGPGERRHGPVGRLGYWAATNGRKVALIWVVIAVGFGIFAPQVETALSGAGWQANGSESVKVRDLVKREFGGLNSTGLMVVLHSDTARFGDPAFGAKLDRLTTILKGDKRIAQIAPPQPGMTVSRDGHTAILTAGANADANEMVRAADDLKGPLTKAGDQTIKVAVTGASGMWSDFNTANRDAMMKSELFSWPVTLAILVLAFGSLVAAGLPLLLTILGLAASAGSLALLTEIFPISIWAMNFAMMFALALGIDYALFIVYRFRGSLFGSGLPAPRAVAETMDTAGKAVLFSGITVLISLSAVMIVNSPAFRSMALGIMIAVVFVLAATLTLLPAILAKLGPRIDALSLPWVHQGEHRSARFARWGEFLWRRPWLPGIAALAVLVALALPVFGLKTGMPSIKVVPTSDTSRIGYELVQRQFGVGAPGALQVLAPAAESGRAVALLKADAGIAQVTAPQRSQSGGYALIQAVPKVDPSSKELGRTIDRVRDVLPAGVLVGGAAAENHDLEAELGRAAPLAIGVVLALGFLLLLVVLQAPLVALIGTATNLLATGAAFGVAKLIFQDGHGTGLLGFESQGYLDAWAPVFFFAMIFAIAMDYTVFLLSSAKEHWDRGEGAKGAMVGGLAHSGRVIFAAAGVMVAVFFTFALSGPLPPKEMGVILGIAVLLDAALVRLLLVPVLLRIAGEHAWRAPAWLRRVLPDIKFGH